MHVGDQGDREPCGLERLPQRTQGPRRGLGRHRQTYQPAAGLAQGADLRQRLRDLLGRRGGHRLDHDRMIGSDSQISDGDGAGLSATGLHRQDPDA